MREQVNVVAAAVCRLGYHGLDERRERLRVSDVTSTQLKSRSQT